MQRFKSPASAQRFLAVHATVYNLFNVKRLSILTPDRRAKLTPLSGTAEVVPVVNRGGTC